MTLFVRNLDQSHERRFNGPNPIQRNKSLPDGSPKLSPSDVASLPFGWQTRHRCHVFHLSRDPRPRRAAEALAGEGVGVEVICLKETEEDLERESCSGLEVTPIPVKHRRTGKLTYLLSTALSF